MKFSSIILFLFLIFINLSSETYIDDDDDEKPDPGYEDLLKWGLSHNLTITEKIRFIKEKTTSSSSNTSTNKLISSGVQTNKDNSTNAESINRTNTSDENAQNKEE